MKITAEGARLTFEIGEKMIANYIQRYLPESHITIGQTGEVILTGTYGALPFRITADKIRHDARHISLIFRSGFISILSSLLVKFLKEEYLHFNLHERELGIDILQLLKSPRISMPQNIAIDAMVIEKCFFKDKKITVVASISGHYTPFQP